MAAGKERFTVWMIVTQLMEFGGAEERLTALATALKRRGHRLTIITLRPVVEQNQYVLRLHEAGIGVLAPPSWIYNLATRRIAKEAWIRTFLVLASPITLLGTLLALARRRRPVRDAWEGIQYRAQKWLEKWLLPDYGTRLTHLRLDGLLRTKARPDIVHVHGYRLSPWEVTAWASARSLPVVFEEHSSPSVEFGYDPESLHSTIRPDGMIAVSRPAYVFFNEAFSSQCLVAHLPPVICQPTGPHQEGLQSPGAKNGVVEILCAARLVPEKGIATLLEAARGFQPVDPKVHFSIAGDGPLKDELAIAQADMGLSERVSFLGSISREDLIERIAKADVIVLPSLSEGLPMIILEAMAAGKTIVATTVGEIPWLIENEVSGLLVPVQNPVALERALKRAAQDDCLRQTLGSAAYQAFIDHGFSEESVVQQFLDFYCQSIGSHVHH